MIPELSNNALAGPTEFQDQPEGVSGGEGQDKPWRLIGAVMRGRYRWVALLSCVLGAGGAALGWFAARPIYRSGVPILVAPSLQRVLYPDEEKGPLQQFERYVETQIMLIQNQTVMEGAVDLLARDDGWRRAHVKTDAQSMNQAIVDFSNTVSVVRSNELITVYVSDPDPNFAFIGAKAVVDTFQKRFLGVDAETDKNRMEILLRIVSQSTKELTTRRKQISEITDKYAAQDIDAVYNAKFTQVLKSQAALGELNLQLTLATAGADGPQDPLSVEDLMLVDPVLAGLARDRERAQFELRSLASRKLLPDHSMVIAAQSDLALAEASIRARVQTLRSSPRRPVLADHGFGAGVPLDPQRIQAQITQIKKAIEIDNAEMLALYKDEYQVTLLRDEMAGFQQQLDKTTQRIEELRIESQLGGRMTVRLDAAVMPLAPFSDPRKKYAALGGIAGLAGGYLLILAIGLMDRRLRHSDEVSIRLSLGQILGLLPSLPQDLSEPDQAAIAAHAVHHIRAMLQIRSKTGSVPVFAVTSPVAGAGKTSLVLGLGLSFAATHCRTLLIDCDLIGGGLTSRLKTMLRQRIGRILVDRGLVTEGQLRTALRDVAESRTRVGERLVQLGHIAPEDLENALRFQEKPANGLLEALHGTPLKQCVVDSGIPGLWILPLGAADPHHASSLSPTALGRLFDAARQQFDTILVDTGPVPGSLEASVVSAQADRVVMIVTRGESSRLVQYCVSQLNSVGARLAGIVFNRAQQNDVAIGSTARRASSRVSRSRALPDRTVFSHPNAPADFGPVARAVAGAAPSSGNDYPSTGARSSNGEEHE